MGECALRRLLIIGSSAVVQQRLCTTAQKAGHMTASDHCLSRKKFLQAEGHPHMRRPLQPEQQRGGQSDGSPAQCRDRKNIQALTQVSTRG